MAGSYFKGWVDTQPYISQPRSRNTIVEVFIGHVLSVDYDQLGKIKVRVLGRSQEPNDDDIELEAYPADMNIIKYPLPGELVVLVQSLVIADQAKLGYYYISVLSSDHQVHYNSTAYLGISFFEKIANEVYTSDYETRFEDKLKSKSKFIKSNGSLLERGPLRPYEGDFILQSRFGSSFRFGSTGEKAPWSNKANANNETDNFSKVGDPILVIAANKRDTTKSIEESINTDQSSIYFCSTQVVKISMSTGKQLATHKHKFNVRTKLEIDEDHAKFLDTVFQLGPPPGLNNLGNGAGINDTNLSRFNFDSIPGGKNNYRSAQVSLAALEHAIKTYGIKRVVRFNGSTGNDSRAHSDTPMVTHDEERLLCEKYGVSWQFIYAQDGYKAGYGYLGSINKVMPIMEQGSTLIHCAHGADRTGYLVACHLKKTGVMTNLDALWEYTVKYNDWDNMINKGSFFEGEYEGFSKYADGFYPLTQLKLSKWNPKKFGGTGA